MSESATLQSGCESQVDGKTTSNISNHFSQFCGELLEDQDGQIALQAACRITNIAEELLSQDMISYVNTDMITCFFNSLCIHTISTRRSHGIGQRIAEKRAQICLLGLKELNKTWDMDVWVLELFSQHVDHPTKKRLQLEQDADTVMQQNQDDQNLSTHRNGAGSCATTSAQSALPNQRSILPQPDLTGFDWTSIS